jgi:hypothetical protein
MSGHEIKKTFGDHVWDVVFWLWQAPITWGQLIAGVAGVLLVEFIKHLFH